MLVSVCVPAQQRLGPLQPDRGDGQSRGDRVQADLHGTGGLILGVTSRRRLFDEDENFLTKMNTF